MNKQPYYYPFFFYSKVLLFTLFLVSQTFPVVAQDNFSWPIFLPALIARKNVDSSCFDTQDFTVCSASFENGARLSDKYTLDGQNISPHLSWYNAPDGTVAFGIFVYDPDGDNWVHWMVKVPGSVTSLAEGAGEAGGANLPAGSSRSSNSFLDSGIPGAGGTDYDGPFPPIGSGDHQYVFQVYALDSRDQAIGEPASISGVYSRD